MITYKRQLNGWFEQGGVIYEFSLELYHEGEQISGQIEDVFGKATFQGIFDGTSFNFLKSYYSGRSEGVSFQYVGKFDPRYGKVSGRWHHPPFPNNNGEFGLSYS